ncbi:MAG: DUF4416 family protein [Bdellovibrionota bacterium]
MLKTLPTPPGLLFGSFLYSKDHHTDSSLQSLWIEDFGASEILVPEFNPLIQYYTKEMPGELARFLIITQQTFSRSELLSAKLKSMEWENQSAISDKRTVNIDIGFLSLENFLLATTKNYSHRIFIGHDIFADLTFEFKKGAFSPLPWTYPDYQDPQKIHFLTKARNRLLASFLPMT